MFDPLHTKITTLTTSIPMDITKSRKDEGMQPEVVIKSV